MIHPLIVAVISISLSVAAQFFLKAGVSGVKAVPLQRFGVHSVTALLFNPSVIIGFALYGVGALVWLAVLSRWEVSKAYPLVGLGFVLTMAVGWALGEQVTILRLTGVALICAGILCVGSS